MKICFVGKKEAIVVELLEIWQRRGPWQSCSKDGLSSSRMDMVQWNTTGCGREACSRPLGKARVLSAGRFRMRNKIWPGNEVSNVLEEPFVKGFASSMVLLWGRNL